jgi:8-amino-7-oxononanoate synthase
MALFDKYNLQRQVHGALKEHGIDPVNVRFDEVISPTEAIVNGRQAILIGTHNYLGLTFDPACIERSVEAVKRQGTGTTGSRVANGSYDGHRRLERELAEFYGVKGCMVFTTGYQANLGVISALAGRGDHLMLDADSHASIYDASRLGYAEVIRFRHNNPDDLYKRLKRLEGQPGDRIIVVEGIYSMLGDTAPLKEFVDVKKATGAYLLVDEAHSMGVLGEKGRGLAELVGVEEDVDFTIGTFSKSLGAVGGFCVSNHPEFELLRVISRPYMFTASLPPAVIASTLEALNQIRLRPELRANLLRNAHYWYNGLAALGYQLGPTPNPIVAVAMPSREMAVAFWKGLLDAGLYLNLAVPPATPTDTALLRTSISAAHTKEQLDRALAIFEHVGQSLGYLSAGRRRVGA